MTYRCTTRMTRRSRMNRDHDDGIDDHHDHYYRGGPSRWSAPWPVLGTTMRPSAECSSASTSSTPMDPFSWTNRPTRLPHPTYRRPSFPPKRKRATEASHSFVAPCGSRQLPSRPQPIQQQRQQRRRRRYFTAPALVVMALFITIVMESPCRDSRRWVQARPSQGSTSTGGFTTKTSAPIVENAYQILGLDPSMPSMVSPVAAAVASTSGHTGDHPTAAPMRWWSRRWTQTASNTHVAKDDHPQSTDQLIKKQYRQLCLLYHPDKNVHRSDAEKEHCEHRFKLIQQAYALVGTAAAREAYNMATASAAEESDAAPTGEFYSSRTPSSSTATPCSSSFSSVENPNAAAAPPVATPPPSVFSASGPAVFVQYVGVSLPDLYRGRPHALAVPLNDSWRARYRAVLRNRKLTLILLTQALFLAAPLSRWCHGGCSALVATWWIHRNVPRPAGMCSPGHAYRSHNDPPRVYSVPIYAGYKPGTKISFAHPQENVQVVFVLVETEVTGAAVPRGGSGSWHGSGVQCTTTAIRQPGWRLWRPFARARSTDHDSTAAAAAASSVASHDGYFYRYWRVDNDLHVRIPVTPAQAGTALAVPSLIPQHVPSIPVRVPLAVLQPPSSSLESCRGAATSSLSSLFTHEEIDGGGGGTYRRPPKLSPHSYQTRGGSSCSSTSNSHYYGGTSDDDLGNVPLTQLRPSPSQQSLWDFLRTKVNDGTRGQSPATQGQQTSSTHILPDPEFPVSTTTTTTSGMYHQVCVTVPDHGWPIRKTGGYGNLQVHFVVVPPTTHPRRRPPRPGGAQMRFSSQRASSSARRHVRGRAGPHRATTTETMSTKSCPPPSYSRPRRSSPPNVADPRRRGQWQHR